MTTQTGSIYISESVTDIVIFPGQTWIYDNVEIEESVRGPSHQPPATEIVIETGNTYIAETKKNSVGILTANLRFTTARTAQNKLSESDATTTDNRK